MKISTKGRYALRVMVELASQSQCISLRDITTKQEISMKYMEHIINLLCKAGLVTSVRGANGGYKLSLPPSEYKVGDILRATVGDLAPVACLVDEVNQCPRFEKCSTVSFWDGLYKVIEDYVDGYTLADLVNEQGNNPFY